MTRDRPSKEPEKLQFECLVMGEIHHRIEDPGPSAFGLDEADAYFSDTITRVLEFEGNMARQLFRFWVFRNK